MKIYFAHYWKDYNSQYEKKCIEDIMRVYPGSEIVDLIEINDRMKDDERNPPVFTEEIIRENLEKYFYSEIDKCDIVIVSSPSWSQYSILKDDFKEYYSRGVQLEIEYAKNKGKKVIDIHDLKVGN